MATHILENLSDEYQSYFKKADQKKQKLFQNIIFSPKKSNNLF